METVFVLTHQWNVENGGQDMECCDVFLNEQAAYQVMMAAYYAKLNDLYENGKEESECSYIHERSAYISCEDAAEFWQWRVDEKGIK